MSERIEQALELIAERLEALELLDELREIRRDIGRAIRILEQQVTEPAEVPGIQLYATPSGDVPICLKHGEVMHKREKQGDEWYSHSVIDPATGEKLFCRGYPDRKNGPGWFIEPEKAEGEAAQPGTAVAPPSGMVAARQPAEHEYAEWDDIQPAKPAEPPAAAAEPVFASGDPVPEKHHERYRLYMQSHSQAPTPTEFYTWMRTVNTPPMPPGTRKKGNGPAGKPPLVTPTIDWLR